MSGDRVRLPATGDRLSVVCGRRRARLASRVLGADPDGRFWLRLRAESVRRRARIELEWTHPLGLVRAPARVETTRSDPAPALQVRLTGTPAVVERREHLRASADLTVLAWLLTEPTRLFGGKTRNLAGSGALLRLPGLPPATLLLDLWIDLGDPLMITARIVRREWPDLVAVAFEKITPHDQERLVRFVLTSLSEQEVATDSGRPAGPVH